MLSIHPFRSLSYLLLTTALALAGCGLIQPVTKAGTAPTPVESFEQGGVDNPDVYVDPEAFQAALLQALVKQDTKKLRMWMTEPFLTGIWRADLSDLSTADALNALYANELGAENRLALVKGADLKALMGGKDPLSIPRSEAASWRLSWSAAGARMGATKPFCSSPASRITA